MPESENLNPVGLALTQFIQSVFTPIIQSMVATEVTKAMVAHSAGRAAATLLDDELENKVRSIALTVVQEQVDMDEDRVNELIDAKINGHETDYDHDRFMDKSDVAELIDDDISERNLGVVDADDDDFRSAVCAVIRNNI